MCPNPEGILGCFQDVLKGEGGCCVPNTPIYTNYKSTINHPSFSWWWILLSLSIIICTRTLFIYKTQAMKSLKSVELCVLCALHTIYTLCVICTIEVLEATPQLLLGAKGECQEANSLEADCTLGEVFCLREANTGNPRICLWVEAFEETEVVLLLNQLSWSQSLELLAKVIASYLSITSIEEEKHMLFLILNCVELAGTLGIGLITKGDTLGQIADRAIVTCDFGHVVSVLEAVKSFACHKHYWRRENNHLLGS